MTTPETKAKVAVRKTLKAVCANIDHSLRNTPAPMGIGANGRPDMMLIAQGIIFEIEVKAGNNKASALQQNWLHETAEARGYAWVIWGDDPRDLEWLSTHLKAAILGEYAPRYKDTKYGLPKTKS